MWEDLDPTALAVAVAVFVVALAVAWLSKRLALTDGVGLLALLAVPVVAYRIASGYVEKLSVGGWAFEFRDVATAAVEPTPLVEEVDDLRVIDKAGIGAIERHAESLEAGQPIAISLTLGRRGYYSARAIEAYIRAFQAFDPNLTVIFEAQETGDFIASSNGRSVLAAVDVERGGGGGFVAAVEAGDLEELRRLVVLTTRAVDAATTNAEALRMMLEDGVDTLVKTGPEGAAVGIVRRDAIVSRLLVELAD